MAQRAYNHAEYLAQRRKRILVLFGLATPKAKSKKQKAAKSKTDAAFKVVLGTTLQEFGRRYWVRTNDLYDVNVAL